MLYQYRLSERGAGFIEVLVALVILAIGLLGVLSMQVQGLRSQQQAVFTTDATMLANDMANRIQAYTNPNNIYDGIDITANDAGCNVGPDGIVTADCVDWIAAFAEVSLPAGRGNVTWNAAGAYTISIRWDHNRLNTAAVNGNTLAVDCASNDPALTLTCYQLEVQP